MKKIFTLAAAVLASFSLAWATDYYTPTAEEVVEVAVTGPAIATHAAIGNASGTYTAESGKNCCDPSDVSKTKSQFALDLKDGNSKKTLVLNIAGCDSICLYCDRNDRGIKAVFTPSVGNAETIYGPIGNRYTGFKLDPNKSYSITFTGVDSNKNGADVRVAAVRLIPGETCNDPQAHLAFTKSTAYVGEQFSYDYGSLNGGALNTSYTLDGVTAVENTDYTFTSGNLTVLKAGQFVMHRTVDAENGYCAVDVSDTILINEATPVASVTVDGPTATYVGESVTFTATAENASDYAWTVNGVDANTNAAEFTFTPAAAGEYSIVCSARNKFNAANVWIDSEAKVLTASNVSGELLKVTVTGGKTGTVTGIFGGTADINVGTGEKSESDFEDQHGYKLNSNGYFVGVHSLEHALAEGDTAIVYITTASANLQLFSDKGTTKIGELIGGVQQGANKVILNSNAAGAKAIYLYRADIDGGGSSMNPYVAYISVVRPKAVDHVNVALVGVAIDGEALPDDFVSHLINQGSFTIQTSYVNAPVVAFVKHTDTYYEGETEPVSTNDSIKVTATDVEGQWQAQATIGENTYTITLAKAASVVVTYMDGETVLGTENVAVNGNPAEYAQYQSKDQATFVGWYSNADLADEHAVADMSAEVITAATTYYAKFVKTYISANVNIEQLVLDNGTSYDIQSALTAAGWDYANLNSLDTLNDLENKTNRNYDFLGLKMKTAGAYIQGWCPANEGFIIKFGNLGSDIKVTITGATTNEEYTFAKADLWSEDDQAYVFVNMGFSEEVLVKISTVSNGTVVLKQLMLLNEGIQEVTLPAPSAYLITIEESENGTVTASWDNKKYRTPVGATVTLTFTPAENHIVMSCTVNGTEIHQSAPGAAITFEMPAEDVTITTLFSIPTAIDNAEAAVKAEKVIRDGQVLILRDGKIFNALGAEVK